MVEDEMNRNFKTNCKSYKKKMKYRRKKLLKQFEGKDLPAEIALHSDTYDYLVRLIDIIDNARNDIYEMEVLTGNVFNEIKGNEVYFAKIRITSKVLEELLPYAGESDFNQFITPFTDNLRPVFTDRVASHILQAITEELLKRYIKMSADDANSTANYCDPLLKISVFALNNIDGFMWESSSNYVIRTILNVLSGSNSKGEVIAEVEKVNLPSEFDSTLEKFAQILINSPQFTECFKKTLTSGLIQTLLFATKHLESTNKAIMKKIIKHWKSDPLDLKNEPIVRLIETAVEVANEEQLKKIYKRCFKNDLKELSISKTANFAVQKLVRNCKSKKQFDIIINELSPFGENILEAGNTGVLLELAQGCVRHKSNQGEYIKMMMRILKCQKTVNEDSDLAPLTCCMVTSDKYNPQQMTINLHGTLIIQAMLNFGKPIKVINSLLNMDTLSLLQVICDVKGCHIVDAFMQSHSVGEKSRDRLFKKLTGFFTKLATSKHGSRALDAIWSKATTKNRVLLLEELKKNQSEVTSDQFGKIFAHKTYLSTFLRNKEDWIKRERTLEKTKRFFSDVIPAKKIKCDESEV